jgi:hypothetical protein
MHYLLGGNGYYRLTIDDKPSAVFDAVATVSQCTQPRKPTIAPRRLTVLAVYPFPGWAP